MNKKDMNMINNQQIPENPKTGMNYLKDNSTNKDTNNTQLTTQSNPMFVSDMNNFGNIGQMGSNAPGAVTHPSNPYQNYQNQNQNQNLNSQIQQGHQQQYNQNGSNVLMANQQHSNNQVQGGTTNISNIQAAHNNLLQKNINAYSSNSNGQNFNVSSTSSKNTEAKKLFNITGKEIWESTNSRSNSKKYDHSLNIVGQSATKSTPDTGVSNNKF